ncbi:hypothetical protein DFJ74DRAFT_763811 [Hyaloraphidium curvatum]|nr:hypothetical protein DFJ74DRAFT_763811 [Hyaloraphidium curvatum]
MTPGRRSRRYSCLRSVLLCSIMVWGRKDDQFAVVTVPPRAVLDVLATAEFPTTVAGLMLLAGRVCARDAELPLPPVPVALAHALKELNGIANAAASPATPAGSAGARDEVVEGPDARGSPPVQVVGQERTRAPRLRARECLAWSGRSRKALVALAIPAIGTIVSIVMAFRRTGG